MKAYASSQSPRQLWPGAEVPAPIRLVPSMNALEILRETARVLRTDSSPFLATLAVLICPVSAALLSDVLLPRALARSLSRRLALLATTSGLPPSALLLQLCSHLSTTLLSSLSCLPLLLTFLPLAKASVAYCVACSYASSPVLLSRFATLARSSWRRLLLTYLCAYAALAACLALSLLTLLAACSFLFLLGYPPDPLVFPAALAFSVAYAHTTIVCNLATAIAVLEERSGLNALLRSVYLVRGQTQAGLLIFLGSTIGMGFVQGLFEHRVKTLSYGDGSSRLWEGPLLVLIYSFLVLLDMMMSAVFYFACRSSSILDQTEDVLLDGRKQQSPVFSEMVIL